MAGPPSKERELALVEKVDFKFALADDDAKFQSLLSTFLVPLLLKLGSEHVEVRQKVIAACQHVKARIKPENIQLPVAALIKQFQDHVNSRLIRHFDLLYIQDGFRRLPRSERAKLLPSLAAGISQLSSAPANEASVIFNIFLQALVEFQFPPKDSSEDLQLRDTLGLSTADVSYLTEWIGKLILFRSTLKSSALSREDEEFLNAHGKEGAWNASSLTAAKYACVKLIASKALSDDERFKPALLASADPNKRIAEVGEEMLKRCLPEVDTDDKKLLGELYQLYLHKHVSYGDMLTSSVALRIKILSILSKSTPSTSFTDEIRQIVAHDLVASDENTGAEMARLRSAIVGLLLTVARQASRSDIELVSQDVVGGLKLFLDQQYDESSSYGLSDLRGRSFEVIGLLASTSETLLLDPELILLRWLFRCLGEERNKQVVFSISEALALCIRPLQSNKNPEVTQELRTLLLDSLGMDTLHPQATLHALLRFTNGCLPATDASARWINIFVMGSRHEKSVEITEEAQKGLDPYWLRLGQGGRTQTSLPTFPEMAAFLLERPSQEINNAETATVVIKYIRQCLFCWASAEEGQSFEFTIDWQSKLDVAVQRDLAFRRRICQALRKQAKGGCWDLVQNLFKLCCHDIDTASSSRLVRISTIAELVSVCPDDLVERMAPSFSALEMALTANDFDVRLQSSQAFGLLASHPVNVDHVLSKSAQHLNGVLQTRHSAVGAGINRVHGAFLALSSLISLRNYRGVISPETPDALREVVAAAIDLINQSSDTMLLDAALRALGQLAQSFAITLEWIENHTTFDTLAEKVMKFAKEGNDIAILALGHLSMILDEHKEEKQVEKLLDHMHALHEIRQPETQFSVGEALSVIGLGWQSTAMESYRLVDGPKPKVLSRANLLQKVVTMVLTDCKTTKPALKKASVIWLLCLIQFCGHHKEVQDRLREFQSAFKRCLSDRDELVQESASRGLGLVYEKGNRELKDDLVRDLVSSFSSNKADMSGTVDQDTQLFEPGALPTGEGSVSTYKDIMSLASEVGDPSLVYRFMSLASNNAIWSNRAAFGRFGLSNVLSDSSVDGYLANNPKMYPALYRYRFDPNSNVRRSMDEIWSALIEDPVTAVNEHFDLIINDLFKNMTGREWRSRQASCAAVADLLSGRRLVLIQQYLEQAWSQCFKVLDDIKATVRKEAAGLAQVLTKILINNLESSEGKTDILSRLLTSVLAFLLSPAGVESGADEVKVFALSTLLEIVKKSKPSILRPFLPDLISQLLLLLTSFEPDVVNYVSLNAQEYKLTQSDIDDSRLKSIRSSPIMDAVERALDALDERTMSEAVPKLLETMRTVVGVPSKVACSRVMVSLCTRKNVIFRPFADQALSALERRVMDRNETVSSSYAASFGYLARIASDKQILAAASFAQKLYFGESDDDRPRFIAAEIVHATSKFATDRFNALASSLIPFVFFGRFDDAERVRLVFKETYDEIASGPRVVSLYLAEILTLSQKHLGSQKWTLKHGAAKVLSESAQALSASHGSISTAQADLLWPPLQEALAQKTWDGKADILTGFVVFAEKSTQSWRSQYEADIKKIALREARRRNRDYQVSALQCLGKIAAALENEGMLDDVNDVANAVISEMSEAMDVDERESKQEETREALLIAHALEATFRALRVDSKREMGAQDLLARSIKSLDCAQRALSLPPAIATSSQLTTALFASLKRLCEELSRHRWSEQLAALVAAPQSNGSPTFFGSTLKLLSPHTRPVHERPRKLHAEAISALVDLVLQPSDAHVQAASSLRSIIQALVAEEKSIPIRDVLLSAQRRLTASTFS